MTNQDIVSDFMEQRRLKILQLQESKGLKASGLSARLLTTNEQGDVFQLVDQAGYFDTQEFGKAPGSFPSFQKIYEWLALKKYGLNWTTELQRRRIANAIIIKIKRQGTFTYRRKKPTGVLSEAINKESLNDLIESLLDKNSTDVITDVTKILQ